MDSPVASSSVAPSEQRRILSNPTGLLRALRYRNYRLFFGGQGISLIGTWLTRVAMSWLVYRLAKEGHSVIQAATLLGIVGFASQIPIFVLSPIAGVIADRWNRHTILVVTQVFSLLQSLALALLTLGKIVTVPQIIVLAVIQGFINAFDTPARQAFVVEMVEDREDLPNAIALNSSMFNGARLIGPAAGGVLIALIGEGWCFMIDAISYIAVIAALLAMTTKPEPWTERKVSAWDELREGFTYTFGFAPIRDIILLVGLVSLLGASFQVLMPIFGDQLGGAKMFGFLMAAIGIGALGGSIYLAARRTVVGLGRVMAFACGAMGLSLIGFAISRSLWPSLLLMGVSGYSMIVLMASGNTILQTIVDDDKRGRVMALYTMAVLGMAPFGNLLVGYLATHAGPGRTLEICGISCIVGGFLFFLKLPALRVLVRPIFIEKGILPATAQGLQAADEVTAQPKA